MELSRFISLLVFIAISFFLAIMAFKSDDNPTHLNPRYRFEADYKDLEKSLIEAHQRKQKVIDEFNWLKEFDSCLKQPGMPAELMSGFSHTADEADTQIASMDRKLTCPCIYNKFAKSFGKTTINGIRNSADRLQQEEKAEIFEQTGLGRKEIIRECIDDPDDKDFSELPDMSEIKLDALKNEAQKLYDEAAWAGDNYQCKSNAYTGTNNIYSVDQCDCISKKMLEAFGYKRPNIRYDVMRPPSHFMEKREDLDKKHMIEETCAAQYKPATKP